MQTQCVFTPCKVLHCPFRIREIGNIMVFGQKDIFCHRYLGLIWSRCCCYEHRTNQSSQDTTRFVVYQKDKCSLCGAQVTESSSKIRMGKKKNHSLSTIILWKCLHNYKLKTYFYHLLCGLIVLMTMGSRHHWLQSNLNVIVWMYIHKKQTYWRLKHMTRPQSGFPADWSPQNAKFTFPLKWTRCLRIFHQCWTQTNLNGFSELGHRLEHLTWPLLYIEGKGEPSKMSILFAINKIPVIVTFSGFLKCNMSFTFQVLPQSIYKLP